MLSSGVEVRKSQRLILNHDLSRSDLKALLDDLPRSHESTKCYNAASIRYLIESPKYTQGMNYAAVPGHWAQVSADNLFELVKNIELFNEKKSTE